MTNSAALREWIKAHGFKLSAIAGALGKTPYTLQLKIDNQREFKVSEIMTFVEYTGMSTSDRDRIFFNGV